MTPTPATLKPVLDESGVLLLERATCTYRCPACRHTRGALARYREWICSWCGEPVTLEIPASEWKRLTEEHAALPKDFMTGGGRCGHGTEADASRVLPGKIPRRNVAALRAFHMNDV
jgi:hypothetical protein